MNKPQSLFMPAMTARTLTANVLETEHPTLTGRARISWSDPDLGEVTRWGLLLSGLVLRVGDRVLINLPDNAEEPIITGVIAPVASRDEAPRPGPQLQLKGDEALHIAGPDGAPWLEVQATQDGPRIKLLVAAEGLSVPGTLRLSGDEVELEARRGEISMKASGDVVVDGETINLN